MNQDRREFLGTALMTIVAAKLGMTEPRSSFGPVKQIDAGVLNVGYVEAGRADAPAVIAASRIVSSSVNEVDDPFS